MCNLAAYAGGERAAPKLLEMMKKQEGFAGGYSSGIATVHNGKLHSVKCVGDFEELCEKHDAESLPGNTGIAHSRSKEGGGLEWAHPFLDCSGKTAYMANGHKGYFENVRRRNSDDISKELMDKGHAYRSSTSSPGQASSFAGEGKRAHNSEVFCHLVEEFMKQGARLPKALESACVELPSEIAGLALHADSPGEFFGLRFNQPLLFGKKAGSAYAATTALAFPKEGRELSVFPAPVNSVFRASAGGIGITPFPEPAGKISDNIPWLEAGKIIIREIYSGRKPALADLKESTSGLWEKDAAPQKDYLVYEILRRLYADGKIRFETVCLEGQEKALKAPKIIVAAVEKC